MRLRNADSPKGHLRDIAASILVGLRNLSKGCTVTETAPDVNRGMSWREDETANLLPVCAGSGWALKSTTQSATANG
jgi:hypothetical protein